MKILMYTGAFLPHIGGAELVVHNLAEGLASIGADITVATFARSKKGLVCGYELKRISTLRGLGRLKGKVFDRFYERYKEIKLAGVLKNVQPDIIHVHYLYPTGFQILKLKQKLGLKTPIVVTSHGIDIQKNEAIGYGLRLDPDTEKKILCTMNHVDRLIAISGEIFSEYEKLGTPRQKIVQIPNPIAHDILARSAAVSKADFNIPGDMPVILAVGRNHPKKGFRELLKIIKHIKDKHYPVMCVFVGKGVSALKQEAARLGITDCVMFFENALPAGVKYQNEDYAPNELIAGFYSMADIYAMTSVLEGMPLVLIEAMAAGLPVVAMKADGASGLVQNNHNGILVDGGPEVFAQKIMELIDSPEKQKALGENAKKAAAQYARVEVAKRHIKLYQEVIQAAWS
jgi:glycosyltransferase involved in cell wall biosynthesis